MKTTEQVKKEKIMNSLIDEIYASGGTEEDYTIEELNELVEASFELDEWEEEIINGEAKKMLDKYNNSLEDDYGA